MGASPDCAGVRCRVRALAHAPEGALALVLPGAFASTAMRRARHFRPHGHMTMSFGIERRWWLAAREAMLLLHTGWTGTQKGAIKQ
jgi:hypothetical protein